MDGRHIFVAVAISREIYGRSFAGSRQPRYWNGVALGVQSPPPKPPLPVGLLSDRRLVLGPHVFVIPVHGIAFVAQCRIAANNTLTESLAADAFLPLPVVSRQAFASGLAPALLQLVFENVA